MFDKMYYINLDRRTDRNKLMVERIKSNPLLSSMKRYSAIDGKTIDYSKKKLLSKLFKVKEKDYEFGKSLTEGSVGLHYTFLEIYKKNVMNDYGTIFICEDDCVFVDGFEKKIIEYWKNIPDDWDMIHFGYLTNGLVVKDKISDYFSTYEYKPGNTCFVVNLKASKIFTEHMKTPIMAVDSQMVHQIVRKGLINAYITNENLCIQDETKSDTIPPSLTYVELEKQLFKGM